MNRYIAPILLILLSLFIYQFYIIPLRADLRGLDKRQEGIAAALKQADIANETLAGVVGHFENLPNDTQSKLDQFIPEKNDATRLLIETTDFLEKNGYNPKSLVVSEGEIAAKGAPYKKFVTTYSISASYETFKIFLSILEKSLALRDVVSVSFGSAASTEGAATATTDSSIRSYNLRIVSYSLR